MDDFKPELLKALLDWVITFELPSRVTTWNQLEDGQVLWQILADIDPDYFNDSLPNFDDDTQRRRSSIADSWIPKWQNLKHIERAVSTYIREECGQLPVLTKRMIPDLKTGARDGSMMLTAKLTMAVLLAGIFSANSNARMVKVMTEMPTGTAEAIAGAIQEMQQLDQRMAQLGVDEQLTPEPSLSGYRTPTRAVSGAGSSIERDSGLEQEALLVEANKDRHALREKAISLQQDLEKSRIKVSQLEEELVEARLHLDHRPKSSGGNLEQLQNDLIRERQYIADLENDLNNAKDVIENQRRRLDRVTTDEPSKQDLRDQLQLVKAERDELSQKSKANENLKKKIQQLTQETKALETLRSDYQVARERLQELEAVEERAVALEKVNKENGQTIVQCEQSIFEEKSKRTRVEHDNLILHKQLEQTKELQYRAEEAKRELEERLEAFGHAQRGGSLEDELNQDENAETTEEPASAKTIAGHATSADAIALQQKVDILNARLKHLESEVVTQMQENLGLRSDFMRSKDEEAQRPFLQQNEKLQSAENELEALRRALREKDLKLAELTNELDKKSGGDEEAKAGGLRAEHERLLALQQKTNQKLRDLELAVEEKTGLLRTALLDRNNLNPELIELKKAETLYRIKEQIQGVVNAPSEARPKALDSTASDIADTVLQSQAALDIAKKDLDNQRTAHEKLRDEVEKAKKDAAEKGSPELLQEVENLRRENKLITSAWYDITTRLQSNTVILQRKSEAPKSWLGKQRVAVGGAAAALRR
ncbi:hypothetical protein BDV96DRAFT_568735 [Lophiotrema nucula]|uniref:HOOK N-terminal domain-containing protein n=1 Tax=Lophiotrema nucula TaxID=690887 RepID=A0A6A5ZKZ6_9PLEO|nr:hypothetical protein BDV96DRAFT_568735 [Lophiotrema nucula]